MTPLAQVVTETARTSSYITGQFVIDGALLIGGLKVIELVISKIRTRKTIRPGEGRTCGAHEKAIIDHRETIIGHESKIAVLIEFKESAKDTLERIEGKLDRLIEKR